MCGRVVSNPTPSEVREAFDVLRQTPEEYEFHRRYNIPPSCPLVCVRWNADISGREAFVANWGLVPSWSKDGKAGNTSNAVGETVAEMPSYRSAYKKRRCLVVVNGFFEWDQLAPRPKGEAKQPYYFTLRNSPLMPFAGLWETWRPENKADQIVTCTIITTTPNSLMAPYHDRLPVILPKDTWGAWLDPDSDPTALKSLLVPYDSDEMQCWPVSKIVNDARDTRNDTPDCIKPIRLGKTLF